MTARWAPITSLFMPADQRAGLGAGEEGDGHALHVVEQRDPQVVDEALADPGRPAALDERQAGLGERPPRPSARPARRRPPRSSSGMATSMIWRISSGGTRLIRAASTMVARNPTSMRPVGAGEAPDPLDQALLDPGPGDRGRVRAERHVRSHPHAPEATGGPPPARRAPIRPLPGRSGPNGPSNRRRIP